MHAGSKECHEREGVSLLCRAVRQQSCLGIGSGDVGLDSQVLDQHGSIREAERGYFAARIDP